MGDQGNRAGGDRARQRDRNDVAAGIQTRTARDLLGGRKECHERSIVRDVQRRTSESKHWRRITSEYAMRHRISARFQATYTRRAMRKPRFPSPLLTFP